MMHHYSLLQSIAATITTRNTMMSDEQWRFHGGGGRSPPPARLGPKKFIARPKKHTHLQTPFCMPECAKTHLKQSRISKFSGGGRGRIGKGREGREGTGEGRRGGMGGGGEGRGARHGLRPPRDKLWIRPCPSVGTLNTWGWEKLKIYDGNCRLSRKW